MKKLALILLAIPTMALATLDSSCNEYTQNRTNAFKISKSLNKKNILYFSVGIDEKNCEFSSEDPVVKAYWLMGEDRTKSGITSCEAMTQSEIPKFLGYKNQANVDLNMGRRVDGQILELEIPNLENLGEKMGDKVNFSKIVTIELEQKDGICNAVTTGVRNSQDIEFDQINFKISFFMLKKVTILKNNKPI
jgi:hypothetical protein